MDSQVFFLLRIPDYTLFFLQDKRSMKENEYIKSQHWAYEKVRLRVDKKKKWNILKSKDYRREKAYNRENYINISNFIRM